MSVKYKYNELKKIKKIYNFSKDFCIKHMLLR
jgi:hypothetical protein